MKHIYGSSMFMLLIVLLVPAADAQWRCLYATWDDPTTTNSIGSNCVSVGVIKENMFAALVSNSTECFLIPYVNADSTNGRRYSLGYGGEATGVFQVWTDGGFDQVVMNLATKAKATKDSLIYVANNDADHNVLVFKYIKDTVTVVPVAGTGVFPRQQTGAKYIHGLDVDSSGYVYVCNDTSNGVSDDLKIYKPIKQWTASHTDAPLRTIDLPDGIYKGIAVNPEGTQLFIADFKNRKVLKYTGSPTTGFTLASGFQFALTLRDTIPLTSGKMAAPLGLAYLKSKNILAVACDSLKGGGASYRYGRIYFLNANTGAFISTDSSVNMLDQAAWNFKITNAYNNRTTQGNASGYTSTYDVKWDEKENIYSVSYYGWTAEKWRYNGTLPSFSTGVEPVSEMVPTGYTVSQNYPNPFNPATTIDFAVPSSGFVSLRVYDLLGREVAMLLNEEKAAGSYRATFDATNLPSGTYFYALKAGAFSDVKKMVLVK